MRILLVTPAEVTRDPRARRQAAAALAAGAEVHGLCRTVGAAPAALPGVAVTRVGTGRLEAALRGAGAGGLRDSPRRALQRELRGLLRLARLARDTARLRRAGARLGRFDVVHANDFDTLPPAWLLARRSTARLVYDAHEVYSAFESAPGRIYNGIATALESALAQRAADVITVTPAMAAELERRLRLQRPLRVVMNCPPLDPAEPDAARTHGRLRVAYLAAVGHARPLDDLLKAAAAAPEVELWLHVLGANAADLQRQVGEHGLAGRAHVLQPVEPDQIVPTLRAYDVGVVIDRPLALNNEVTLPNKLFEYLMAGLAVVAPDFGALRDFVEGERVGLTFESDRPASLAAALTTLARDRRLLEELRRRARRAAVERYNAEAAQQTLRAAWGIA